MDYAEIKKLAKERGQRINELIALAPKNDPFYTGARNHIEKARWFKNLWDRFGYIDGIHIRRMHYQIVSQDPPILEPDGTPYENTEADWKYLVEACKHARYLGLVDPDAFVDRRNPEAIINAKYWHSWGDTQPGFKLAEEITGIGFYNFELPSLPRLRDLPAQLPMVPRLIATGYEDLEQKYHIEIWCEKTTMNDVLGPLCSLYDANLVTGAGELSITSVVDLMRRARGANRPVRILYVSDFDPAGLGMPISVSRKIEFFQRKNKGGNLDIRLRSIVLLPDQVKEYNLPRVPVKETDLRKAAFEVAHGKGQVELDALEALHPGVLEHIVERAVLEYYDPDLQSCANRQRENLIDELKRLTNETQDGYQAELDEFKEDYNNLRSDFAETRKEFDGLVSPFQKKLEAYRDRLAEIKERREALWSDIENELDQAEIDFDDERYCLPEPALPEESNSVLYDSQRDYFTQLEAYQAHRDGEEIA